MKRTGAIILTAITGFILLILVTDGDWVFIVWMAICAIALKFFVFDHGPPNKPPN